MVFGEKNVGKSILISRFLINHVFEEKRDFTNEGIRKMMM
jgi:GTPase SAR1 family protein